MKLIIVNNLKALLYSLMKQLELFNQSARTRKQLLKLDDHLLKDVGLTQHQALQESRRYFWQGSKLMDNDFANKSANDKQYEIKARAEHLLP